MTGDRTVLLIGGPAAVGKTSAAKRLAVISVAALPRADDVWLALQGGRSRPTTIPRRTRSPTACRRHSSPSSDTISPSRTAS
ncbi:MAG TPA: hypothetical protein VFC31_07615 [Candidatus Limnocylindria bacterium]|nr:hypothetical protein [Candidatus Limnocylindria bacterium]